MASALDPGTVREALVFAVCLLALLVAHQVGDHVLQSDRQAADKVSSPRAMAGHLIGYHVAAATLVVGTAAVLGLPLTVRGVLAGLGFSALTHGLLDLRWPVRAVLTLTRSPLWARTTTPVCGLYAADQALHHLALLISALLIAVL